MFFDRYSKNVGFLLVSVILIIFALVIFICGLPSKTMAEEKNDVVSKNGTLNVSAEGKVSASPDIAYMNFGVVTEEKSASVAQKNNSAAMSKVISSIKEAGVDEKDIKTTDYSIYPKYNYIKETGESHIIGYKVKNSVQITIRDISKVGDIIDIASENGVNVSGGISFGLSDYDKYYNEALKKAVEAAKSKAQTIAESLGITLKTPVSVSEQGGSSPITFLNRVSIKSMDEASSTPIQSGTIEIKANIHMTYNY